MKFCLAALALVLFSVVPAVGQIHTGTVKIVNQADAPIEIREHRLVDEKRSLQPDQATHETTFVNRSSKKLVAIEFTLVKFSLFNEFMSRAHGVDAPDKPIPSGPQIQTARWGSPKSASDYLIGVLYVSRVRFDDGQIWKADLSNVIGELKAIDVDFDSAVLKR